MIRKNLIVSGLVLIFSFGCSGQTSNELMVYQLADISDMPSKYQLTYSNLLPTKYRVEDGKIVGKILSQVTVYDGCAISDTNNWECAEGNWSFGARDGVFYSNSLPEENIVVSRLEYSINSCRWYYAKEGLAYFLTRCPLALYYGH